MAFKVQKVKGVIFDFDGTLVDSVNAYVEAYYTTLKEHGFEIEKERIAELLGYSDKKIIETLINNSANAERILEDYRKKVRNKEFASSLKLFPKTKEMLIQLSKNKIDVFILSGSDKKIMEHILEEKGIKNYFKEIISTRDDGFNEKPDPEGVEYILKKHSLKKEEVIFVGDGKLDFLMAKNSGIKFIAKLGNYFNEEMALEMGVCFVYLPYEILSLFRKKLLCLVGLAGSGKSTVRDIITHKYNIPFIRFGDITEDIIKKKNLELNEENEKKVREEIRKEYGMEAYAKLNLEKIKNLFNKSDVVLVDGLYSWEEYLYLKDNLNGIEIILIAVVSDKRTRYYRISERKDRNLRYEDVYIRDLNELKKLNKCFPIVLADYFIENNYSLEKLNENIEKVMKKILFI